MTDELISDEYNNVMQYRQRTAMTEMYFANNLWGKTQRSRTLFSDRRLKSIFAGNLQSSLRRSFNNYLSGKARKDIRYQQLARYAHGLGDQIRRTSRRTAGKLGFETRTDHGIKFKRNTALNRRTVMTMKDEENLYWGDDDDAEGEAVLAMSHGSRAGPISVSIPTSPTLLSSMTTSPPYPFHISGPSNGLHWNETGR